MVAAVLWDLDGTLVDSREDLAAAANVARAALGYEPLPVATIGSYVGNGMSKLLERSLPDEDAAGLAKAKDAFVAYYAAHCIDATPCYAGIPELLAAVSAAGIAQAVVTNKPESFSRSILAHLGLTDHFAAIVGGDGPRKPDPAHLQLALDACGVAAADAWMIGDHHTDIIAGRAAGCAGVGLCEWGFGNDGGHEPDCRFSTTDQVLAALGL
ncbi:MAG: HAD family hydrolase [Planctomycetota bacterium]|jgi:phosphoglycolate phosphatase